MIKKLFGFSIASALLLTSLTCQALVFSTPKAPNSVIGRLQMAHVDMFTTIADIDQKYDVGVDEMVEANPGINPEHLPSGSELLVPTRFILPNVPHKGIVINLPELRLYYFDKENHQVITFPIGIGKKGWATPVAKTEIVNKKVSPVWIPTQAVREDYYEKNDAELKEEYQPGPDNPLGHYMMRLGLPNYLMHGTNDPSGVGKRASAGCIRMFNPDMLQLFERVYAGMSVNIIDEPYKAGWSGNRLFLEAHAPFHERAHHFIGGYKKAIYYAVHHAPPGKVRVNWKLAKQVAHLQMGVPQVIGRVS